MTDRNLLEDFWSLAAALREGRSPEDFEKMCAYWGEPETREPWGACVLVWNAALTEVLTILGSKNGSLCVGIPGGKPLKNETPAETAARELGEETDLFVPDPRRLIEVGTWCCDNGVLTHLFTDVANGPDRVRTSEGYSMWVPSDHLYSSLARFPLFYEEALRRARAPEIEEELRQRSEKADLISLRLRAP